MNIESMKKRNKANHVDENVFVMDILDEIAHYRKWQKKNIVNDSNAVWIFDARTWKRIGYVKKSLLQKIVDQLPAKDKKLFDI